MIASLAGVQCDLLVILIYIYLEVVTVSIFSYHHGNKFYIKHLQIFFGEMSESFAHFWLGYLFSLTCNSLLHSLDKSIFSNILFSFFLFYLFCLSLISVSFATSQAFFSTEKVAMTKRWMKSWLTCTPNFSFAVTFHHLSLISLPSSSPNTQAYWPFLLSLVSISSVLSSFRYLNGTLAYPRFLLETWNKLSKETNWPLISHK